MPRPSRSETAPQLTGHDLRSKDKYGIPVSLTTSFISLNYGDNRAYDTLGHLQIPPSLTTAPSVLNETYGLLRDFENLYVLDHERTKRSSRDRYSTLTPYNENRVRLSPDTSGAGYINASYIYLGRPGEWSIATQGPLEKTVADFWLMVWQENSPSITMLCRPLEGQRENCEIYYPLSPGDIVNVGFAKVECVSIRYERSGRLEIRELRFTHSKKTRKVIHYLFMCWPDHSIPRDGDDQQALLRLIEISRPKPQGRHFRRSSRPAGPRIVHCSAGVGRTGTFIALDYLLMELKEGKLDSINRGMGMRLADGGPVFETIKLMREQRGGMVDRSSQYIFIHGVLMAEWNARFAPIEGRRPRHQATLMEDGYGPFKAKLWSKGIERTFDFPAERNDEIGFDERAQTHTEDNYEVRYEKGSATGGSGLFGSVKLLVSSLFRT